MNRPALSLSLALFFLSVFISPVYAGEIRVDIMGPEELTSLAPGIQNSIAARCIAKGIHLEDYPQLAVTILKMGDTLSYDAILKTTPPRAFHSDLGDISGITTAIDDMIATMFDKTPVARQEPRETPAEETPEAKQTGKEIKLPFAATSVIMHDGALFISDTKTLYVLKGERPLAQWETSGNDEIFRLYSYGDSIIALIRRSDMFHTFQIRNGETIQHWDKAVIPIGKSLVSSQITSDDDMPEIANSWPNSKTIAGETCSVPEDADLPSVITGDIMSSYKGNELANFNSRGQLTVQNNGKTVWSSETYINALPLYLEQDIFVDDPPLRYYMMPRILMKNGNLITINNDRGMTKIFGNVSLYTGADILLFSPEKTDLEDKTLAHIRKHYCADIALSGSTLIALVINNKESYVRMFDL